MKFGIIVLIAFSWVNLFGQNTDYSEEIYDCEVMTNKVLDKLTRIFTENRLDSFDIIIDELINQCGLKETTQRFIILKSIKNDSYSIDHIRTYFENDFPKVHRDRIRSSKENDFGYIYTDAKAYFGYVPLRHPLDSIVMNDALKLLETKTLSPDEKLICLMFSGDIDQYDKALDNPSFKDSYIKQYLLKKEKEFHYSRFAISIYFGFFRPISSNDIFSTSPMFGITLSSPLDAKLVIELAMKMRININDKSFVYYALGDTNLVNSDVSIFGGVTVGLKVYENENLILMPKFGFGLEYVETGLSTKKKNSEDKIYFNIETLHLSLGFTAIIPVSTSNYLGIGINYHFCPYSWDSDLKTLFDNHLISTEIFWRY